MTDGSAGVLAGLKVVEFAQNVAIPHCGRLLAGMGADVIKVEPPTGDAMRWGSPLSPWEGRAYAVVNQGKRSMPIDLASERSAEVVDRLLAWADVALVAFKAQDRTRYRIGWEHAHQVNPRLVYLAGNAYGPEGDDADVGGYDVLAQARSGTGFLMNRVVDGAPTSSRPAVNDTGTGIVSALGVVAALRHRDTTGVGQRVDTSLLGTALSLGTPMIHGFEHDRVARNEVLADLDVVRGSGADFETVRDVYEARAVQGRGTFRLYFRTYLTSDSMITVAGLSPGLFAKFHDITGVPKPNGAEPDSREFAAIVEAAEALFRTATTAEWLERLRAIEYPCGPYNTPLEALEDPQIRANGYVEDFDHPAFGEYTASGMPLRFSETPGPDLDASPAFGSHSRAALAELGFDAAEIGALIADGVVLDSPTS